MAWKNHSIGGNQLTVVDRETDPGIHHWCSVMLRLPASPLHLAAQKHVGVAFTAEKQLNNTSYQIAMQSERVGNIH